MGPGPSPGRCWAVNARLVFLVCPGIFLGWWGGGAWKFCSSPLKVLFLLFCFLVSYEESNPKDAAAVTEGSKEGTEPSASKGLEKKEK